jgi:hypothetical protein
MRRINWGQAAGEALLILFGILLALGAEAWWEERSERREEHEYLEALAGELEEIRTHGQETRLVASDVEHSGLALMQVSSDWPAREVGPDSLGQLITGVSQEVEWSPPLTVYQDLVNTGAVAIIQSQEVRAGLNELLAAVDWVGSRQARHNEFFWEQMEPYYRRHLPVSTVFGFEGLAEFSEPWVPGPFVDTEEFRNMVAAKTLTALDVRDGAEALVTLIDRVSETIRLQAGGL